jgi:hypothetical protein
MSTIIRCDGCEQNRSDVVTIYVKGAGSMYGTDLRRDFCPSCLARPLGDLLGEDNVGRAVAINAAKGGPR